VDAAKDDRGLGLEKEAVIVALLMSVNVVDNGELR